MQVSETVLHPSFLTIDFMLILLHQAVLKERHCCQYIGLQGTSWWTSEIWKQDYALRVKVLDRHKRISEETGWLQRL